MATRYTVYDTKYNDKPILIDVKHKDVCVYFGIKSFDYIRNCHDGQLYRERYRVVRKINGEEEKCTTMFSEEIAKEWEEVCERYRNFEWRKTWSKGVKVLTY